MQLICAAMFSVRNSGGWNRGDTSDTDFDIDTDAEAKTNTNTRLRKPWHWKWSRKLGGGVGQMKMIERRRVQTCVHCTVAHCAKASKASSSRPKGRLAFVHSNISIASNNLKMHCHEHHKQTFFTNKHFKQTNREQICCDCNVVK